MSTENEPKTHKFKAEVSQVLSLVINSLYSNKDIAIRELISNAADALDRLRFEAIEKPKLTPEGYSPRIRLIPDTDAGTLTIADNGIGMSAAALAKDLGTVARSGTREFGEKLAEAQKQGASQLIGQFGVGFYSGYLVADRIEVISRAAGSAKANRWASTGEDTFTMEPAERDEPGTSVILHLKEDLTDFANEWKLRELVTRYSDFINHTIELRVQRTKTEGEGDDKKETTEVTFEAINEASALWTRAPKDIKDEQYEEFYRHLTHDYQAPLTRCHFSVEGTQVFTGLLFVPRHAPFDMFNPDVKHGVRLHVKRVFIMEDCEELLPKWLRFVRGIIDSDDLPLNVSRELLQDSALAKTIRKQIVRRVLDALSKVAEDSDGDYLAFWNSSGAVLKEGLHFDPTYRDKIAPLLRYESSAGDDLTSLTDYVSRMPEEQKSIYYALGPSRSMIEGSPQLEGLKKRGYEILYMTDGVDQWAADGLREFDGKPLANAMEADLDFDLDDEDKQDDDDKNKNLEGLVTRAKDVLSEHVSDVRLSTRLTDSAACLVLPKGGLPAHIERMIRAQQRDMPAQKRILELNPDHALVEQMRGEHSDDAESEQLTEWIELLYDQALISEGSPLPNPARFAQRMTSLMTRAASA